MTVFIFAVFGVACQAFWAFGAACFALEVQPIPLFVLFAYAVLAFPLAPRLFLALVMGWLIDLHAGGVLGFHAGAFFLIALGGAWFQRNLSFFRGPLFGLWVLMLYLVSVSLLGFLTLPFEHIYNPFSFFAQLQSAFWHGIAGIAFYPLFTFVSKLLRLESEQSVYTHEGWAHGR